MNRNNLTRLKVLALAVAGVLLMSLNLNVSDYDEDLQHQFDIENRALSGIRPPYDTECPLVLEYFHSKSQNPDKALAYSLDNEAPDIVAKAFGNSTVRDRKVVLIGDSNFRQIFASMACISFAENLWKNKDSYTAGMLGVYAHDYNDARLKLREGLGELFLAPKGGKINEYDWDEDRTPMDSNEDWLKSCQEGEPFHLDTFTYEAPNERIPFDKESKSLERVPLGKEDVVIINGSIHPLKWKSNQDKLASLLACMADSKAKGQDPGWPTILYFRSNQRHSKSAEVNFEDSEPPSTCPIPKEDPFITSEKELFEGKVPLVGFDLDLAGSGHLHMNNKDCGHWAMPGVTDVYAKKMAEQLIQLDTISN